MKSKFRESYPLLMAQKDDNSFQRFGLEIGSGWLFLVYELFGFLEDIQRHSGQAVSISQIKEKFGSLRIYLNSSPEIAKDVDMLESLFESLSVRICDICSAPGRRQNDEGYWCTRCDKHRNTADGDMLRRAAQEAEKDFIDYQRQGVALSGYVHLKAVKSPLGEGYGTLTLTRFPDHLDSIPSGLMDQVSVEELADRPVSDLEGVVKELKEQKKRLFGTADASIEADIILGNPVEESAAQAVRALRDSERK
ncbi:hypothetical protein SAMN04487881_0040 [Marinobacter sp. es.048]|uniref:hypothetical protein n=1 Tax=Marinobacter sp. es.048 TaxID=1761795 RepID=UPI000B588644|nr:hypothetical protein [Marinobacter sp. es.048]SNC59356.1 hypothetical protein SAMN04487881_0040 [Marinobacter sp. es.048]